MARNPKKRISLLDEVVPALIKTKWGQYSPYNNLCPYDEKANNRTVTGCVATTMAQIMKYWSFPVSGRGEKTYTDNKYGELYADFANTTYDWDNMTNEYNQNSTDEQKTAVATLMYHCGIALSMRYGVAGSSSINGHIASSLKSYFMYDTDTIITRSNYVDNTWADILKENLDNSQPIAYGGRSRNFGSHSFICDGYDTDGRFHFNLGWNGNSNGYYYIDSISTLKFNLSQEAVINIKPIKELNSQVSLLNPLELKQEIVYQNSTVKIDANIVNNKVESFSGSISLRLFDAEDNFLINIAEQKIDNLEVNNPTEVTFETNPLFNTSVGNYYVKLYYKHDISHNWLLSSGNNKLEINVQKALSSENQLSLYSSPILEAYKIDKEKVSNIKATASFINTSEEDFTGVISASIYDEKGTIIKELASYNVTEAIAPSDHIENIEFSNTILDLDCGIYFIGFRSKYEGGEFALINTNNFISFVKFEIVPPELITDLQLKKWIKFNIHKLPEVVVNEDGGIYNTTENLEALAKIENLNCTNSELISIDELIRHMLNLKILECNNNSLIELDLSKNIELTTLQCNNNQINNLDLSKNIGLITLQCNNNQINNLNVSKNIELIRLICFKNQLNNLDLSKNINLTSLSCYENQLTNLDLSKNIELTYLTCFDNQLINLDLSKNIELERLYCTNNSLVNLDLSKNIKLYSFYCDENQLTNLDLTKNIRLSELVCKDNILNSLNISPLLDLVVLNCCNQAEGFILYLTNKQKNIFNEYHYCDAILKENGSICEIEWLDIYPNPTADKFSIESKFFADEIKILNLAGEVLYRETLSAEKTEIDISNLPAGVYFVITKGKIGKVVKN